MTAHEVIFGDRLERACQYIIACAFKINTRTAYKDAIQELGGINTLLIFMSAEGGPPMPTANIMIRNEQSRLQRIVDSPTGCVQK